MDVEALTPGHKKPLPSPQGGALAMLARLGQSVDMAENGLEAAAVAGRQRYALILTDMQMPEMDGLEATRQIRSVAGPSPSAAMSSAPVWDVGSRPNQARHQTILSLRRRDKLAA